MEVSCECVHARAGVFCIKCWSLKSNWGPFFVDVIVFKHFFLYCSHLPIYPTIPVLTWDGMENLHYLREKRKTMHLGFCLSVLHLATVNYIILLIIPIFLVGLWAFIFTLSKFWALTYWNWVQFGCVRLYHIVIYWIKNIITIIDIKIFLKFEKNKI